MLRVQNSQHRHGVRTPHYNAHPGTKGSFWGLVQQRGPFEEKAQDLKRLKEVQPVYRGGGVFGGGKTHAGHGEWFSEMNTTTKAPLNALQPAPPRPSQYAEQSIVIPSRPFKKPAVNQVSWELSHPTTRPTSYNPPKVGSEIPIGNDKRNGQPAQNESSQQPGAQNQPGGLRPAYEMPTLIESSDVDMDESSHTADKFGIGAALPGGKAGGVFGKVLAAETKAMANQPNSIVIVGNTPKQNATTNTEGVFIPETDAVKEIERIKKEHSLVIADMDLKGNHSMTLQQERFRQELNNRDAQRYIDRQEDRSLIQQALERFDTSQARYDEITNKLAREEELRNNQIAQTVNQQLLQTKQLELLRQEQEKNRLVVVETQRQLDAAIKSNEQNHVAKMAYLIEIKEAEARQDQLRHTIQELQGHAQAASSSSGHHNSNDDIMAQVAAIDAIDQVRQPEPSNEPSLPRYYATQPLPPAATVTSTYRSKYNDIVPYAIAATSGPSSGLETKKIQRRTNSKGGFISSGSEGNLTGSSSGSSKTITEGKKKRVVKRKRKKEIKK